jgi:predicted hotdog family 3-hydroxylacyl-ACP dehydratase
MTARLARSSTFPAIEALLPHRGTMLLIERVVAADDASIEAEQIVPATGWYLDTEGRMPAWIGIEAMAQAIAAHVSLCALWRGEPPRCGVLLGAKDYRAAVSGYGVGERLRISARHCYGDESGFSAYDCAIAGRDGLLARAGLKVFQPADFDAFVRQVRQA